MGAENGPEQAAEAAPQAPSGVADTMGTWWAKLTQPETLTNLVNAAMSVLFVLILAAIIYAVVMMLFRRAIARIERDTEQAVQPQRRRQQRIITVLALLRSIAKWVILIAGFIWVLAAAGQDIRPLLAGAGIAGLAIGFGSQNLVRDLVSGFFLLLEGQYAVGDYIQVGANFGLVESIGVRTTVLKDIDNQLHHIPNGTITALTVYEEPFVNFVVETPVADAQQSAAATEAINEVARELKGQYHHYLIYFEDATSILRDHGSLIRLPVAVFPTQEWMVNEEIPQRIKEVLAHRGVALSEGRDVRTYVDLSRMPQYKYDEEVEDDT